MRISLYIGKKGPRTTRDNKRLRRVIEALQEHRHVSIASYHPLAFQWVNEKPGQNKPKENDSKEEIANMVNGVKDSSQKKGT